jgi:hypothetical protein
MTSESEVERLITQIVSKLDANRAILARSVEYGRLVWRRDRRGRIEIKIQPDL